MDWFFSVCIESYWRSVEDGFWKCVGTLTNVDDIDNKYCVMFTFLCRSPLFHEHDDEFAVSKYPKGGNIELQSDVSLPFVVECVTDLELWHHSNRGTFAILNGASNESLLLWWETSFPSFQASLTLLFAHKNLISDLMDDWSNKAPPDLMSFVPYTFSFRICLHDFEIILPCNAHNWIDCFSGTRAKENGSNVFCYWALKQRNVWRSVLDTVYNVPDVVCNVLDVCSVGDIFLKMCLINI